MFVGSLFSGVGGFDLGFERAGMTVKWQVEIDDYCQRVLEKHWPNVRRYSDVRDTDDLAYVDLVCGGFPCQPHSLAGERRASGDERDLWPAFARVIRQVKPQWVVAENVYGLLSSESGRYFGGILRDPAALGYDATWRVLRASDIGAIHRRERVFLVAHPNGKRIEGFWEKPLSRVEAFSWCKTVRGPADLRGRPDLPEPLIRRKGDGDARRMDALGNAVVPQIVEWIGRRIMEVS